jgi:hypothetical protein
MVKFSVPHVATSKEYVIPYSTDECTFLAEFTGNPRFFVSNNSSVYDEVYNVYSSIQQQITLSNTGSNFNFRVLLNKDDIIYRVYIKPGTQLRYKEFKIHGDYIDTGVAGSFNGVYSYTSPILDIDIQKANLNRGTISIIGSNLQYLQGSLTNDTTNWIPIEMGLDERLTGSDFVVNSKDSYFVGSGRNIQYKLYDPVGSSYIQQVTIEYKSDDYVI